MTTNGAAPGPLAQGGEHPLRRGSHPEGRRHRYPRREMVCLLGGNASGKTTTLKTMLGYLRPSSGTVYMDGENVNGWSTAQRVGHGLTMVPENRRLFKRMTVKENLEIGAYLRQSDDLDADYELCSRCSLASRSASPRRPGPCPGVSSRWWPWGGPSWRSPRFC